MHLFSPSQVSLWNECQRKWAWKYIAKIKIQQHLKAALGDEVEKLQLIPYLTEGRPFEFGAPSGSGYIAASSLAYLPQPKTPGMVLQKHFVIPSPTWIDLVGPEGRSRKHAGFGFQGYMDMYLPDAALAPDEPGEVHGLPYVADFKTKSTFKYALTEKQLRTDTAANMYAFATMYETKQKQVRISWLNMLSEGPRQCKRVNLTLFANDVAQQFSKDNATAIDMFSVVQSVKDETDRASFPLTLAPSPNQCRAFGGCPHQHRCNLSPVEQVQAFIAESAKAIFGSISQEENMTPATNPFLAKLQAKKAAVTGAQAQPTTIPPYAEQVAITAAKDAAAQAAQVAQAVVAPLANTPAGTVPLPAWALETTPYQGQAPTVIVGLNPPESALPPAPPISATKRKPGRPPKVAPRAAPPPNEGTIGAASTAAPTPAPTDPAALLLATTPQVAPAVVPPGHVAGDSAILQMAKAYDLIAQGFSELAKATRAVVVGK